MLGCGLGTRDGLLERPPLGGGAGICGCCTVVAGNIPLCCFFKVLVGACAVFMLEYGRNLLFGLCFSLSPSGVPSRFASMLLLTFAFSCASNGLLNTLLLLCGLTEAADCAVNGEAFRLFGAGWKLSSKTLTKLLGKSPIARGSLRSLPIHHCPSPAFRASMRSPSMNPRSFLVSPPHEYVAWHQHGKRAGICIAPISKGEMWLRV